LKNVLDLKFTRLCAEYGLPQIHDMGIRYAHDGLAMMKVFSFDLDKTSTRTALVSIVRVSSGYP